MQKFSFLEPGNLKKVRNITEVSAILGLDSQEVHSEYRLLQRSCIDNYEQDMSVFWKKIANRIMPDDQEEFPVINDIVERVSVLPHSSAMVEHIFRVINLNKIKIRNYLSTNILMGILHTKHLGNDLYEIKSKEFMNMI